MRNWQPYWFETGLGRTNLSALMGPLVQFFETFSYLPPLTNDQIARQVDFVVANGTGQ